jgi:hypothetical protein
MSKNASYSRYSTSFKLAVNLGIADQTDISSLPSSTRHNFRNADFTDLVGKEYEGLTKRLDQVKEILDSRTATAVAHSIARVAFFMKRLGKDAARLKKIKSPQIREAFIDLVERTKKFIPEKQILKFFDMTQRRFSLWKTNPIGCTRAPRFDCIASYPTQLTNDEISKVIKAFRDSDKSILVGVCNSGYSCPGTNCCCQHSEYSQLCPGPGAAKTKHKKEDAKTRKHRSRGY